FGGGGSALPDGVGPGDFSARWTGTLTPAETQRYSISINGAGGVRVWLDGKSIIDDWTQRAAGGGRGAPVDPAIAAARSATGAVEKGRAYALKVEFFRTAPAAPAAGAPVAGGGRAGAGGGRGGFGGGAGPTLSWQPALNDIPTAAAAARQADVVVAVVGITRNLEGEEMGVTLP